MRDLSLRAPGLYLGALEPSAPPAARTAVTAFVGVTARGPLHRPQTLRNFGEFLEVFGAGWDFGSLTGSVYAFFLNGGEEACVVRVGGPLPALPDPPSTCVLQEPLEAARSAAPIHDANGQQTLRLKAKNEGAWGNALSARLFAESPREMELGQLTVAAAAASKELQVDFVHDYRAGAKVRVTHRENPFERSEHLVEQISGAKLILETELPRDYPAGSVVRGRGFRLDVTDGLREESFDGLSMNPAHPRYFADVINGPPGEPYLDAARAGHSLLVSAERVLGPAGALRFKPVDSPAAVSFTGGGDGVTFARGRMRDPGGVPSLRAVSLVKGRAGNEIRLRTQAFTGKLALPVPAAAGGAKDTLVLEDIRGWTTGDTLRITDAGNPALTETAVIGPVAPNRHELGLNAPLANSYSLGSTVEVTGRFNLSAGLPSQPEASESFFNLSLGAGPRFFKTVVNGTSQLICLDTVPSPGGPPDPDLEVPLEGGTGPEETPLVHLLGYHADGSLAQLGSDPAPLGIAALEGVPEVNLLCVPDLVQREDLSRADLLLGQRQMLQHCEKAGERFALLDVPRGKSPGQALEWPLHFSDGRYSRFGALYYPWLSLAIAGAPRWLPPSGAVAGLVAQADRREGVGRAPANLALKGVVELERDLEADQQGELNLQGVNCIRKFEVGAIRLWGARTLSAEESQRYVSNRRVVLMAIKALSRNLRWAVFEPNDARLRQRIKDSIAGFLQGMLARGLTAGGRPEDAFYVKVDETLNNADTAAAGQVLAEVGIALSRPAEFIVITVKRRPEILTLVEEEA